MEEPVQVGLKFADVILALDSVIELHIIRIHDAVGFDVVRNVGDVAGEQDGTQDAALRHTRLHLGPAGVLAVQDNSLCASVKV